MSLVQLEGATKGFNDRTLFQSVDFELGVGERVGLVGRNGCGKSSLLRILAGVDPPDDGTRIVRRGVRVGYLEQEPILDPEMTARDVVRVGIEGRAETLAALAEVHEKLSSAEGAAMDALLKDLERYEAELEARGGHDVEHQIEATLDALDVIDPDAKTGPMSGGERRRVALARLLVSRPDVLLLDEPTNHLDAFVTDWLEDWFLETRQPLVLVTHDRYLLERVVDRIVEVDNKQLFSYAGGYSDFIEARAARLSAEAKAEQGRLTLLRRETAWIRRGPPARTTKSKARVQAYDELVDAAPDVAPEDLELRIPAGPRLGARVVELHGISKAFGERTLIGGLDLEVTPEMRLGIVGPNGAGKSTLMRIVSGEIEPDAGVRSVGETVRFMGIDQGRSALDLEASAQENVAGRQEVVRVGHTDVRIESYLAKFGFDARMRNNLVRTLSGGERARVMLAKLLLEGGNVALLDEPTNDLDLTTLRALEEALIAWPGALLVVTHDRWFLDRVATHVLYVDGRGDVRLHHGDVSELLASIRAEREEIRLREQRAKRDGAKVARTQVSEVPKDEAPKARLTPWEEKELSELETLIAANEARVAELDDQLASPGLYSPGADPEQPRKLQEMRDSAQTELDGRYERWSELADR